MTDWEQAYAAGDTPWDKGAPSPGLLDFLSGNPLTGRVLVPGCGLGHDVRAIKAASPDAEVVGLDVAPSAVEQARGMSEGHEVSFVAGDFFNLAGEYQEAFDWVWEHTCFCAIQPAMRPAYVTAARGVLKEGGRFLGVFYLNPYDEEHREGGPPFGVGIEDLEDFFGEGFEFEHRWEPENAYPGREGREWMALLRKKR